MHDKSPTIIQPERNYRSEGDAIGVFMKTLIKLSNDTYDDTIIDEFNKSLNDILYVHYLSSEKICGILKEKRIDLGNLHKNLELIKKYSSKRNFLIGFMYRRGIGVEENAERAFKHFKLSADEGEVESKVKVGYLYKVGYGVKRDYEKAFEYFSKELNNHYIAHYHIGDMYYSGDGVEQNYEKALYHYKLIADNIEGVVSAFMVGKIYHKTMKTDENAKDAFKYYKKASDCDYADAQTTLANFLVQKHDINFFNSVKDTNEWFYKVIENAKNSDYKSKDELIKTLEASYSEYIKIHEIKDKEKTEKNNNPETINCGNRHIKIMLQTNNKNEIRIRKAEHVQPLSSKVFKDRERMRNI